MKALVQRVSAASVDVSGECVGRIGSGILVFLGLDIGDDQAAADKLITKLLSYRLFSDADGKMNLSVTDVEAGVLLVSQFTLSADTRKGLRPSFSSALPPQDARPLYEYILGQLGERHPDVAAGQFGADMQVSLVNDGPVTFMLES